MFVVLALVAVVSIFFSSSAHHKEHCWLSDKAHAIAGCFDVAPEIVKTDNSRPIFGGFYFFIFYHCEFTANALPYPSKPFCSLYPVNSIFLSHQSSHQPTSSTFFSQQISTSHSTANTVNVAITYELRLGLVRVYKGFH